MRIVSCGMAIALAALSLAGSALAAPVETVLYSFLGGSDGSGPQAALIADKEGALYGTTAGGGSGNNGTVFKLSPPAKGQTAWTETVLYRFCSQPSCSDGAGPQAALIADKEGALYGTPSGGGSSGYGTVFKLTPARGNTTGKTTWTETVLHSFQGGASDGAYPFAGLIFDKKGALYGTTEGGGPPGCSCGTAFKLTPPAKEQTQWTETVLYNFNGVIGGPYPLAGLIFDKEGALYGTTAGPADSNGGTAFKLIPPARGQMQWTQTVLSSLASSSAGLIFDKEGALYGTTRFGGIAGTVFKLTPPAKGQTQWTTTILYKFTGGSDGAYPFAGLIFDDEGSLYGTTYQGAGTVFKLTPPPKGQTIWKETVLYNFCSKPSCSDGSGPKAALIADKEGALYSTTTAGGTSGNGTVFQLTGGQTKP